MIWKALQILTANRNLFSAKKKKVDFLLFCK